MFPGNIGMTELLVILFIVLIIFGAGKLPEIGRGLGQALAAPGGHPARLAGR